MKQYWRHQKIRPAHPRGFTLMEVLVAVGVFSIASLIATGVFLVATNTQRNATAAQKLQDDTRFTLENVARTVKYGIVDYAYYGKHLTDGTCEPASVPGCILDLDDAAVNGKTDVLALRDPKGNSTRYRFFTDNGTLKLHICTVTVVSSNTGFIPDDPDKCEDAANWHVVTPDTIEVVSSAFYLYPFADPFALQNDGTYLNDVQPRVTVVLQTQSATPLPERLRISAQTTMVTRTYVR